ncbi:hypothetical protein PV327_008754 [Microctonus hyperodae]|uniref:Uncharacterized protein n=1 Tax=Microctonus hyperodae TaxID=165561 RepID=A0AA39FSE9_MICHY|nr:hypothetical protein PV327_008754 [Microctonus hyperodae]
MFFHEQFESFRYGPGVATIWFDQTTQVGAALASQNLNDPGGFRCLLYPVTEIVPTGAAGLNQRLVVNDENVQNVPTAGIINLLRRIRGFICITVARRKSQTLDT